MHTTACAAERNWSGVQVGLLYAKNRSRLGCDRAAKMIFLKEQAKESDDVLDEVDVFGLVFECLYARARAQY